MPSSVQVSQRRFHEGFVMRIGVIGGLDRNAPHYDEAARSEGHRVEWHPGILAGRGGESLSAIVERSDLIVIITEVNRSMNV